MFAENLKYAAKTWVKSVVAAIMCLFVYISIQFVAVNLFTKEIGYTVYEVVDSRRGEALYTHYYADGEDLKAKEYENSEIKVETVKERSLLTDGQNITAQMVSQVFSLFIIGAMIYQRIWSIGTSDNNKVKFNRMKEDKLRGLKIGCMAAIPSFMVYLLLILARFGIASEGLFAVYRLLNVHIFGYMNLLFGVGVKVVEIPVFKIVLAAVPLLILPVICTVAYFLGYKDISVSEKIIYKNKRKGG